MNIRSVNVVMSEYSSVRNWEFLKANCFVSEKRFAFIAVIAAADGKTLTSDCREDGSIRVSDLSVDIIWKDKDCRMIRVDTVRNVKKINGEDRILTCDCVNWEKEFNSDEIVSGEVIITDKRGSYWRNDDTLKWDVI